MTTIDHIGSAFLRRILRRMKELGVSQSELAKRMKVSRMRSRWTFFQNSARRRGTALDFS